VLGEVLCRECQGAGLELEPGGRIVCRFCGAENTLEGVVCPHCEAINPPGAETCAACRRALTHRCPHCGAGNWSGAERCAQCGGALDPLERLSTRWTANPAGHFDALQRSAAALKAEEEAASQRRLAEMHGLETRRQADLAEARRRQAGQQRVILLAAGLAALAVAAMVVLSYYAANPR
jgi:hypothetical protein